MLSLKQELERAEERIELVEYRSAERAGEIEEALDTHVTRVSWATAEPAAIMATFLVIFVSPGQTALPTQAANSSQVTKAKLVSTFGQTVLPSRASSQENHSFFWLRPRSNPTITKPLVES